jgi:hypothetical protein
LIPRPQPVEENVPNVIIEREDEMAQYPNWDTIPDDRLQLEYDKPVRLDTLPWRIDAPEEYRKCSHHEADGSQSVQAFPASELWVIKIHHANFPEGFMLIYCIDHPIKAGDWSRGH